MYQKLSLIGRVGQDPQLRQLEKSKVASFSVATNDYNKKTTWFRVSVWNKLADTVMQYLHKGMLVFVEGELRSNDDGNPVVFEGNNGEMRSTFDVNAGRVVFLSRSENTSQQSENTNTYTVTSDQVEEIPF